MHFGWQRSFGEMLQAASGRLAASNTTPPSTISSGSAAIGGRMTVLPLQHRVPRHGRYPGRVAQQTRSTTLEISVCGAAIVDHRSSASASPSRSAGGKRIERRYRLLADNSIDAILCVGTPGPDALCLARLHQHDRVERCDECLACRIGATCVHPEDTAQAVLAHPGSVRKRARTRPRSASASGASDGTPDLGGSRHPARGGSWMARKAVFVANIRDITQAQGG